MGEVDYLIGLILSLVSLWIVLFIYWKWKKNVHAILMIGAPASGKTLLSHGIMTYLQATETKKYSDDENSQNRVLREEVSKLIHDDTWPKSTQSATANRISFNMRKHIFNIYDFSGESIELNTKISRESGRNENATSSMEITTKESSGTEKISFDRRKLKHIIYLIPPHNGMYQQKSFSQAEGKLKWIRELTIRAGGDLNSYYDKEVLAQKKTARNIKIHAIFTKFSDINESGVDNEQLKESLLPLCPELYSLVEETNGSVIAVNVFSKDGMEIKQDWVGLEELTQTLNMN